MLGAPELRWWGAVANSIDLIWFDVHDIDWTPKHIYMETKSSKTHF